MKIAALTLVEVAAYVSEHLKSHGIDIVVLGGSSITSWTPDVYTSYDIDFAAVSGDSRKRIASALADIGFDQKGRSFVHLDCAYTLDFVATTAHIDQRVIEDFAEIKTRFGTVRVLKPEDAIADRIAAWVHWSDSESLRVAEESAKRLRDKLSAPALDDALAALQPGDAPSRLRLKRARERLAGAISPR